MATINPSNQTITQYNLQTGGANNLLNNVAPSATSGVPVISQGASAQPVFGTVVVAGGGTGTTTLTGVLTGNGTSAVTANTVTNHGVLLGGASNAVSSLAVAATGTVLAGVTAANPAFTATPAVTSITLSGGSDLANYSTGTWTPIITFGGGSTGITFTTNLGKYWRIGSVIYFSIFIQLSSKGSSTGGMQINNLPFTSASDTHYPVVNIILATSVGAYPAGTTNVIGFITSGSTILSIFAQGSLTPAVELTDTTFTDTTQIHCTGFYWVS